MISTKQFLLKQKYPKGAGTCTLTISRESISEPKFYVQQTPETQFSMNKLSFKVNKPPSLGYGRTMESINNIHGEQDYSLCREFQCFRYLKLCLTEFKLESNKNGLDHWYETLLLRLIASVSAPKPGTKVPITVPETPEADYTKGFMENLIGAALLKTIKAVKTSPKESKAG